MKVHLIRKETIEDFTKKNAQSRTPFAEWRMICKYAFGDRQVHLFICWIGTHAEYDKLCDSDKQYTVSIY